MVSVQNSTRDQLDQDLDCLRQCTYVEEADEISQLVQATVATDGLGAQTAYPRFRKILEKYQEQAQLLDPHLEAMITPLAGLLMHAALMPSSSSIQVVQHVSKMLWSIASVRGYKVVVKFFPNEASNLEPVVDLLLRLEEQVSQETQRREEADSIWGAQCILTLWLAQLVLIPFDLASVDSSITANATSSGSWPPVVSKIMDLYKGHLSSPGSIRDMAALLLGRLLTRPDLQPALEDFLTWACTALHSEGAQAHFLVPGATYALAAIFSTGQRQQLLPFASQMWTDASQLLNSRTAASSVVSRKYAIKLVQRIGLTFLPATVAAWRYQQSSVSINESLRSAKPSQTPQLSQASLQSAAVDPSQESIPSVELASQPYSQQADAISKAVRPALQPSPLVNASPTTSPNAKSRSHVGAAAADAHVARTETANSGVAHHSSAPEDGANDAVDIPEEIEEVIEVLLTGLQDKDTVVRWSAAKGLGRITSRLPQELSDDVVGSVVELFSPSESDTAWHGACLALAELARRGLLLPSRLASVAPLIAQALQYDVRRGPHSVGAHVRDAAAYVCWAFARAYTAADLAETINKLAPALLVTACYDREVNCRRAASAAYQESVGRQGNVPHGIDILTTADYFTLSSRVQAYLKVAPSIAQYQEYKQPLADHLLSTKLRHWDRTLRELTSKALAALVPTNPQFFQSAAVDLLLPLCLDPVLEVRHGAVLGLSEVALAVASFCWLDGGRQSAVAAVVPAIEKARLYRGKGGEIMRGAVCRLVECIALANLPLTSAQHKQLHSSIDDNLRHPTATIQSAACAALAAFAASYIPSGDAEAIQRTSEKYLVLLADPNVAAKRGAVAALGALPCWLLQPLSRQILAGLAAATQVEEDPDERDAETRVAAVTALAQVAHKLYSSSRNDNTTQAAEASSSDSDTHIEAVSSSSSNGNSMQASAGSEMLDPKARSHVPVQQPNGGSDSDTGGSNQASDGLTFRPIASIHSDPAAAVSVREHVLTALLAAIEDYSTDNRGDVGSWVREAAIQELPRCLVLMCSLDPQASQLSSSEQASTVQLAVQALLKQSVERIARVREAACKQLREILAQQHCLPAIPALDLLQTALPPQQSQPGALSDTDQELQSIAALLVVPEYQAAILEGLVASIGGLDVSLCKAASAALVQRLSAEQQGAVKQGGQLLTQVGACLCEVWQQHARSPRLATPLLRTAEVLLSQTPLLDQTEQYQHTLGKLLDLTKSECQQCKDVQRLCSAVAVLCQLVACQQPLGTSALGKLTSLMINKYPKVRKQAAEQLYVQLLTVEDSGTYNEEMLEPAYDVLTEVAWDGPLESVRTARSKLLQVFGLQQAQPESAVEAQTSDASNSRKHDENASYQALINDGSRL